MGSNRERDRPRRLRSWSELSTAQRSLFVPQLLSQLVVRVGVLLLTLEFLLVAGPNIGFLGDDTTGREGQAVVLSCESAGVPAAVGLSWYHSCELRVRWPGSSGGGGETVPLDTAQLDADDVGRTVDVVEREGGDKWGTVQQYVALAQPSPHAALAVIAFLSLGVVALLLPYWYRFGDRDERARRRFRSRFKARPALVVAGGYWLLFAAGAGWPVSPPVPGLPGWGALTWPPALLLVTGVLVLCTGLFLVRYRQSKGYPAADFRPSALGRFGRVVGGVLLLVISTVALIESAVSEQGAWPVWPLRWCLPVLLLVTGARLLLVWWRGRSLPRPNSRSREPDAAARSQTAG
ncbi:hypothetical protein FHU38_002071 [Saccharomonospora amisosensis]|uniref:Ig-like domain-containing protein n=1 Tax=Saccharomonospora amisosensis TaxID=1128677 RepID=A0A7X5ZQG2_9PSEU|nr:DUF6346 domain-containing protein [Saccharomonospora amisosensis]NIJ11727.1 hypothetical protein [Saccharomonospora amisosensis]